METCASNPGHVEAVPGAVWHPRLLWPGSTNVGHVPRFRQQGTRESAGCRAVLPRTQRTATWSALNGLAAGSAWAYSGPPPYESDSHSGFRVIGGWPAVSPPRGGLTPPWR